MACVATQNNVCFSPPRYFPARISTCALEQSADVCVSVLQANVRASCMGRPAAVHAPPQSRKYGQARAATLEQYESPMVADPPAAEGIAEVIQADAQAQDESLLIANCGLNPASVQVRFLAQHMRLDCCASSSLHVVYPCTLMRDSDSILLGCSSSSV